MRAWDVLAIAWLTHPELFTCQQATPELSMRWGRAGQLTLGDGTCRVVTEVQPDAFRCIWNDVIRSGAQTV